MRHANQTAYFSIVRPALEFAFQIWDLHRKKQIRQLKNIKNKSLHFIFNIKGQTSFSQLRKDAGIESLQEPRMSASFSLFTRCLAENIQPSVEYDLEKQHNTRQNTNTYTPYKRTNAHYISFGLTPSES